MQKSSVDAAQAASISTRTTSREVVWDGGDTVVEIRVAKDATTGKIGGLGLSLEYLQFGQTCPGGRVNFYVHGADKSLCGHRVKAKVIVKRRKLVDGMVYIYVDLIPVEPEVEATHRVAVMPRGKGTWGNTGWPVIPTEGHVEGLIVFAPIGEKIELLEERVGRRHMPQAIPYSLAKDMPKPKPPSASSRNKPKAPSLVSLADQLRPIRGKFA